MNESHRPAQPAPVQPKEHHGPKKVPSDRAFFWKNTWNAFTYLLIGEFMAIIIDIAFLLLDITVVEIVVTIVNVFAYCAMIYTAGYNYGSKDLNRFKFGHTGQNLLRGLFSGLVVGIYPLVFCILVVMGVLGYFPYADAVYKIGNGIFYHYYAWIAGGLVPSQMSVGQTIAILLPNLLTPLMVGLGYYLGYKDVDLSFHVIYKRGAKPQTDEEEKKKASFL